MNRTRQPVHIRNSLIPPRPSFDDFVAWLLQITGLPPSSTSDMPADEWMRVVGQRLGKVA
jgi:hypothetical protein